MTVSAGFTAAEIREPVHGYQLQPQGQKGRWLAERGFRKSGCVVGKHRCLRLTSTGVGFRERAVP